MPELPPFPAPVRPRLPRGCKTSPGPPSASHRRQRGATGARAAGPRVRTGPKGAAKGEGEGLAAARSLGAGRGGGSPAQSRLLVARLLNCIGVIVIVEPVHGGLRLRHRPQAPAEYRLPPRVLSLRRCGLHFRPHFRPAPCAPAQIVPEVVQGAGVSSHCRRLLPFTWKQLPYYRI